MNKVDKRIVSFIKKHHVLTLATSIDNNPWCANMFYAYLEEENMFVFTSDGETKHAADATINNKVAASIVLETKVVGKLQGLQIRGTIRRIGEDEKLPKRGYINRFPYAAMTKLNLWIIEPTLLKMTDNTLGFGKKLYWEQD